MSNTNGAWRIINEFIGWQSYNFRVKEVEDACIIVTPFFRADNEPINLEAQFRDDGRARFTDAGETLAGLREQGLTLSQQNLDEIRRIARRFGVKVSHDDHVLEFDGIGGITYLQSMVSAILAVSSWVENWRDTVQEDGALYPSTARSLSEMFERIRKDNPEPEGYVPPPPDAAKNYKHYLYGFPKEE